MEKYCEKWKLKVNVSKTQIIIFGSRKHLDTGRVYLYSKKQIEIVDYFKYLGVPSHQMVNLQNVENMW